MYYMHFSSAQCTPEELKFGSWRLLVHRRAMETRP